MPRFILFSQSPLTYDVEKLEIMAESWFRLACQGTGGGRASANATGPEVAFTPRSVGRGSGRSDDPSLAGDPCEGVEDIRCRGEGSGTPPLPLSSSEGSSSSGSVGGSGEW